MIGQVSWNMYVVKADELPDGHASRQHFAPAQPQHEDEPQPEHEFQRGPQHAISRTSFKLRADIFLVRRFEGRDLGFLLHVGADQARAGKILLRVRGNVGVHGLNTLEAVVDPAAEILDQTAGGGQRQVGLESQPRAEGKHEGQRRRHEHGCVEPST